MGRFVVLTAVAECPVDGSTAEVEVQVPVVLPPEDAPLQVSAGESLSPLTVEAVVQLLTVLRPEAERERGGALLDTWTCPCCQREWWVRAELAEHRGRAVLAGLALVPEDAAALQDATWIDPWLVRGVLERTAAEPPALPGRQLDENQYQELVAALERSGG